MSYITISLNTAISGSDRVVVEDALNALRSAGTFKGSETVEAFENAAIRDATKALLVQQEGSKQTAYVDTSGDQNKTIGVGFNMDQFGSRGVINGEVNAQLAAVLTQANISNDQHIGVHEGSVTLNDAQVSALLDYTLNQAVNGLKTKLTQTFNGPKTLQNHDFSANELAALATLQFQTPALVGVDLRTYI